jgi:hypothetical protein
MAVTPRNTIRCAQQVAQQRPNSAPRRQIAASGAFQAAETATLDRERSKIEVPSSPPDRDRLQCTPFPGILV